MSYLRKVVEVKLIRTEKTEIISSKKKDFPRGGFIEEEVIKKTIREEPFIILECGHMIEVVGRSVDKRNCKKIQCFQCEIEKEESQT